MYLSTLISPSLLPVHSPAHLTIPLPDHGYNNGLGLLAVTTINKWGVDTSSLRLFHGFPFCAVVITGNLQTVSFSPPCVEVGRSTIDVFDPHKQTVFNLVFSL